MTKHARRIVLAASVLLPASACAATNCGDYKYVAFGPASGMVALETRVPVVSGLRDVKPFPVTYAFKREGYRLVARTYERGHGPTAVLSVEAQAPMSLKMVSIPTAADGAGCIVHVEQNDGVKFSWLDKKGCATSGKIVVAIFDASGDQIAAEELPFAVITNGRYCVKDAL